MWRLTQRASHTLESRKFNELIDLFVRDIDLWTIRIDERKLHSPASGTRTFNQHFFCPQDDQLANRLPACSRLFLQLPIERRRDIDGGAYRFLLHGASIAYMP